MQRELPSLFWAWCYAHRLALACKDSITVNSEGYFKDRALYPYYFLEMLAQPISILPWCHFLRYLETVKLVLNGGCLNYCNYW